MIVYDATVMVDTGRMVAMVHVYCTIILCTTTNGIIIMLTTIMIMEIIIIRIIINIMIIIVIVTMGMIGIAIILIIIIIIVIVIIIIIIIIHITWLTTLQCNWIRVYSQCLDSPHCFGLAALVFAAYLAPLFA